MASYGETYSSKYVFDVSDVLEDLAMGSTGAGLLSGYINVVKQFVLVGYNTAVASKGNVYIAGGLLLLGAATAIAQRIFEDELDNSEIHVTYELEYKKRTSRRQGNLYTWGQWTLVDVDFHIEG